MEMVQMRGSFEELKDKVEQFNIDWSVKRGRMLARKSFDSVDLRQLTSISPPSPSIESENMLISDSGELDDVCGDGEDNNNDDDDVFEADIDVDVSDKVDGDTNGFNGEIFSKREASRNRKKERKIVLTFVNQYLPEIASELLHKSTEDSRTLLVDSRDFQMVLSTSDLITLVNRSVPNGPDRCSLFSDPSNCLEDLFVLPTKKFTVLRFKDRAIAHYIYSYFTRNHDLKSLGSNRFILVPDELFEATVEKHGDSVREIIEKFNIKNRPDGLGVVEGFVDRMEEYLLLGFSRESFELAHYHGKVSRLKNREAIHYGYTFDYEQNTIISDPLQLIHRDLPEVCRPFLERMMCIIPERPDQLTINRYDGFRGDHIPFHTDTHSMCTEHIVSLSLGSDVTMAWRGPQGEEFMCHLPARSLMVMNDEARYQWKHGITKTTVDLIPMDQGDRLRVKTRKERFSWTFRKTRSEAKCDCKDCVKQNSVESLPFDPISSPNLTELEDRYVHETYSKIAPHFSSTRNHCWPQVVQFLKSLPSGSLVLDVGCGNGRFLSANPDIYAFGTDRCEDLLKICHERGFEVFTEDCRALKKSVRGEVFDAVLSIAVLHHLSSDERRIEAIRAFIHILSPGGLALIYVWSFEQSHGGSASKYIKLSKEGDDSRQGERQEVDSHCSLPIHRNRTQFQQQDVMVPWTKNADERLLRFYHLFREGELEELVNRAGGAQVVQSYHDQGNWCVVLRKLIP